MFCKPATKPSCHGAKNARRLSVSATAVVLAGCCVAPPAEATASTTPFGKLGSHGDDFGNGSHNMNQITINSPVISRGIQHSSDGTIRGKNYKQNAICRKRRFNCTIIQKIGVT